MGDCIIKILDLLAYYYLFLFFINLIISASILYTNFKQKDILSFLVSLIAFSSAIWCLGWFGIIQFSTTFWLNLTFWGGLAAPAFTIYCFLFPDKHAYKKLMITSLLLIPPIIVLILFPLGHVVTKVNSYFPLIYEGTIYNRLIRVYWLCVSLLGVFVLLKKSFKYWGKILHQSLNFLIGSIIFIICGIIGNLIFPLFFNSQILTGLAPALSLVWLFFLVLSITKYEFLDISLIINRTAARIFTNLFFISIYLVFVILYSSIFNKSIDYLAVFITILLGIAVGELYHILRQAIQTGAIDKWISDFYDSETVFDNISDQLIKTLEIQDIIRITVSQMQQGIKFKQYFYAIKTSEKNKIKFIIKNNQSKSILSIDANHSLITYLSNQKAIKVSQIPKKSSAIFSKLSLIKNTVLVPLVSSTGFEGFLILDEKVCEADFDRKDFALFHRISNLVTAVLDRSSPYAIIKQKYEQALEFAEAVSKQAVLGVIIHGISHEVRNPLFMLKTKASLIDKFLGDSVKMKKFAVDIEDCANRAMEILNKMMAFAQTGEYVIRKKEMSVVKLVKETLKLCLTETEKRHIRVDTDFLATTVFADEVALFQVLLNILLNAMQAIEDTGKITISVKQENFTKETVVHNGICVAISDTGPGISEETIKKIHDPFFTTKYSGPQEEHLGLGLSIAIKIIGLHDGLLSVESEVGKGSTFRVYLPG